MKKKEVLVGGCFDVLHYGHVIFLTNAKKEGDVLTVLLESDEAIIKRKKRKPIHDQKQRAFILSSLRVVDRVVSLSKTLSHNEYDDMVKKIKPDVIAITNGDPYTIHKQKQADMIGAKLVTVTDRLIFSSTCLIQNGTFSRN